MRIWLVAHCPRSFHEAECTLQLTGMKNRVQLQWRSEGAHRARKCANIKLYQYWAGLAKLQEQGDEVQWCAKRVGTVFGVLVNTS